MAEETTTAVAVPSEVHESPATKTEAQLRMEIIEEVRKEFEARFLKEIADFQSTLQSKNDEFINKQIEEWREAQKPPTREEIQMLLSQEYITFDIVIFVDETENKFVLRELPQSVEKKFFNSVKDKLLPYVAKMNAADFEALKQDPAEKIQAVIDTFEPALNLLADAAVLALNPKGRRTEVTREWIQDNLSTYRIWTIVLGQLQIQRLRDFFSQLSRGSNGLGTMTRAFIQK